MNHVRDGWKRISAALDLDVVGGAALAAITAILGAGTVGLALGVAVRAFREAAGL